MPKLNIDQVKNKQLRKIREEHGYSQEDMGNILGIARGKYQYLENSRELKSEELKTLSEHFKLPVEAFIDPSPEAPMRLHEPTDTRKVTKRILSKDEAILLNNYTELSEDSKLMLLGYMEALLNAEGKEGKV